jgi:dinuclear metal center YbgI/SA1388 family protein
MSKSSHAKTPPTVADFCKAMESVAPVGLAQEWDNVGLLAGDTTAPVSRVILCIDLTPAVAKEAVRRKASLVFAYHPPIFKPISRLCAPGTGTAATLFRCIHRGIAVYASHTALDAAEGGTNDIIASLCGIRQTEPIEYVDQPGKDECKLVVFVPEHDLDKVAGAMFAAGAGRIGEYSHCGYRTTGQGTFLGGEHTHPTIGERGQLEFVEEIRLETIVSARDLPAVVGALRQAHSYEEPAFDIYPLRPQPVRGIGRVGRLPRPTTLATLARKLKRATQAAAVQVVGPADRTVARAIILVGAAGSIPFRLPPTARDVIITGEIRHHDALTMRRYDCTAVALGHWASERPVLPYLAERIQSLLKGVNVLISEADQDPFRPI